MRIKSKKIILVFLTLLIFSSLIASSAIGVRRTTPRDGAENVSIDQRIIIEFEEQMDPDSVEWEFSPSLFYPVIDDWSEDDHKLTLTPTVSLSNDRDYRVTVTGETVEGEQVSHTFRFTTEESPTLMETIEDLVYGIWHAFWAFIPGIIFFLLIVLIGYFVSKGAGYVTSKVLTKVGFEKAMRRVGVTKQIKKLGQKSVSKFLGVLVFWFIFVIFIQLGLDFAGIHTLTQILTPIVLFIPRVIIAVIVILVGLYIAEVAVISLKKFIKKSPFRKDLAIVSKKTKWAGFSFMDIIYIFVKAFILLIFINVALSIIAIHVLTNFINPILLVIPLLIAAMAVILVGIIITDYLVRFIMKMLKELQVDKLIEPLESMVERKGITLKFLSYVLQLFIMLIFIQIAVGILNTHGMFDSLAQLVNTVILWIPNLIVALFIGMLGFWIANWAHDRIKDIGTETDLPFPTLMAKAAQIIIIYMAIVIALAQIGIEVPILYIVFGIAIGAVFLGLGVGFAYGSKDLFLNLVGSLQSQQTLKVGNKVKIGEHEGTIRSVGRYSIELETPVGGKVHIPHSKISNTVIEEID